MEYRDFSHLRSADDTNDPSVLGLDTEESSNQNFPVKLHYVLDELEKDGLSHIVGWAPHGRSFCVREPKQFVELILPRWFRQTKYTSFQRQLNIYGYTRISSGPDKGGYFHEMFLRGKSFLSEHIARKQIKGTGSKKSVIRNPLPDFRFMPFLPDTNFILREPVRGPATSEGHDFALSLNESVCLARNLSSLRHQQMQAPASTYLERNAFTACLKTVRPLRLPHLPVSPPPPLSSLAPTNLGQALLMHCIVTREAVNEQRRLFLQSLLDLHR